jgi:hypothetical protein
MEEQKEKQKKMKTNLILIFLVLTFAHCVYSQESKISINAVRLADDSLSLEVKNNTQADTLLFSIYKQQLIDKKWVTNVYDVFSEAKNPKTSILIIYPNKTLNLKIWIDNLLYTDEAIKTKQIKVANNSYRLLISTTKKGDKNIRNNYYSNVFQ